MTAMALQALAPYYNEGGDTTVNAAVDKALQWLSAKYKNTGYTSAESCAQVVVALSALQLNANSDSSFVKTVDGAPTSVLGDLLRYYLGEVRALSMRPRARRLTRRPPSRPSMPWQPTSAIAGGPKPSTI